MRRALIILIVLFSIFLTIGCTENKPGTPNETGTPEQAITPVETVTSGGERATEIQTTNETQTTNKTQTTNEIQNATEIQNVTDKPEMREYTLEELAEYNGKNENGKTYVAYQGKVYDVSNSSYWMNGTHAGCNAGTDLTGKIEKTPHGAEILKGYTVVGTLKK